MFNNQQIGNTLAQQNTIDLLTKEQGMVQYMLRLLEIRHSTRIRIKMFDSSFKSFKITEGDYTIRGKNIMQNLARLFSQMEHKNIT